MKTNTIQNIIFSTLIIFLVVTCSKDSSMQPDTASGQGGSLARFTISKGHLYTVDNTNLKVFDISDESKPEFIKELNAGFGIETIFPLGDNLFLGSRVGMTIYDITTASNPVYLSSFSHIYSCDPVVVEGNYAFVTLSTSNSCTRGTNELQIIDISNLQAPNLVETYSMLNPKGLGIDDGTLFICDNGLKVYDATNVLDLKLIKTFDIKANDVIPYNGKLLVIGDDGFYQYDYSNEEITLLSKINISSEF